jgi:glutamine synthetase
VALFKASPFARAYFGEAFVRVYAVMKEMECAEFERRISSLEYETYL